MKKLRKREKNKKGPEAVSNRDRALVNKALRGYLSRLKGPRALRKAMEYAVFSGGKRLRPILTIESARALKGDIKKALPPACAIEFIHNFSLIHDDLPAMDNDDFRRGKPTCHKKFGESLAILAGDGLLNLAFGIISGLKCKKSPEIGRLLSEAIGAGNMIGGQALEMIYSNRRKKNPRLKRKIDRMKTAALMAVSCRIGALAANAGTRDAEKLYEFGRNLGCAFQVADDIEDSAYGPAALSGAKKEAGFFISKAKKAIAHFGKNASTLSYMTDGILKKTESRG